MKAICSKLHLLYLRLSLIVLVLMIGYVVVESLARYPQPNVGTQPRMLAFYLIPTFLVVFGGSKSTLHRLARAAWVGLLLALLVMDQFNFLLEYDIWIHRGGPESGAPPWKVYRGSGRSFWQEW